MIKSSKHTTKYSNTKKINKLDLFIDEYRRVAQIYLDYLWNNEVKWNNRILNISKEQYDCPTFIPKVINIKTTLSARTMKCCSTQVCGIIKAVLENPRKRQYMLNELKKQNKDHKKLERKNKPTPNNKADCFQHLPRT